MLHEIFETRVDSPSGSDNASLKFEGEQALTYREVDDKANGLAHHLMNKGIVQGDKVGVIINRSPNLVLLLLACSKIGAVYVPLDPKCPEGRIRSVFEDAQPKIVVVDDQTKQFVDSHAVMNLDEDSESIASCSTERPVIKGLSDDFAAYIIYTSGTTGTPKGVVINHSGLNYWADVLKAKVGEDPTRQVLGFISPGFDASIWEYIMAWASGGCLCMTSESTRIDAEGLAAFIGDNGITDATLLPTIIKPLLSNLSHLRQSGLKRIYSTAEALTKEIAIACHDNGIELYNCYGPTEATFGLSMGLCDPTMFNSNVAPISKPYGEDVQCYILDSGTREVVNAGSEGELFIVSPHLSRGYLNRDKETKENFVTVLVNDKECRAYATKDLFVENQKGVLYYKGRLNEQSHVKINGKLVNPVETETIACGYPGVVDAYVTVVEQSNTPKLFAYLVLKDPSEFDLVAFCEHLKVHLVHQAIPKQFFQIDQMPHTVNGKKDGKQISDGAVESKQIDFRSNKTSDPERFFSPLKKEVCKIFSDILSVDQTSLQAFSDFLLMGGDSLKISMLKAKLNKKFRINLSMGDLSSLGKIDIDEVSGLVMRFRWKQSGYDNVKQVKGSDRKPKIFMFHDIRGEAEDCYKKLSEEFKKIGLTVFLINSRGHLDDFDVCEDVDLLIDDYACAVSSHLEKGEPCVIFGWSFGASLGYKVTEVLESKNVTVAALLLVDGLHPNILRDMKIDSFSQQLDDLIDKLNYSVAKSKQKQPRANNVDKKREIDRIFNLVGDESGKDLVHAHVRINHELDFGSVKAPCHIFHTGETVSKMPDIKDKKSLGWGVGSTADIVLHSDAVGSSHFDVIESPQFFLRDALTIIAEVEQDYIDFFTRQDLKKSFSIPLIASRQGGLVCFSCRDEHPHDGIVFGVHLNDESNSLMVWGQPAFFSSKAASMLFINIARNKYSVVDGSVVINEKIDIVHFLGALIKIAGDSSTDDLKCKKYSLISNDSAYISLVQQIEVIIDQYLSLGHVSKRKAQMCFELMQKVYLLPEKHSGAETLKKPLLSLLREFVDEAKNEHIKSGVFTFFGTTSRLAKRIEHYLSLNGEGQKKAEPIVRCVTNGGHPMSRRV